MVPIGREFHGVNNPKSATKILSQCHFSLCDPCALCERRDILEVTIFRKATLSADAESRPSVGLGTDFRLESKKITGFALALDKQLLHISIFARADGQNHEKQATRMERYTRRRRNRR